ncbi:MAG: hypothetical protein U0165_19110 [Polyangiaceae bacterium]
MVSLIGQLMLGAMASARRAAEVAVPVAMLAVASSAVAGCADESQPEYWIKKLEDPVSRSAAARRLGEFYKDAMTKAKDNREDPAVKELLGKIVGPMSKAYVQYDLDEKTRGELLKSLADTRDPGAKDAIIKAIKDFAAGKATADEQKNACAYVKALKLKEASGPLLDAFLKVKITDEKTGPAGKPTRDAMMAVPDAAWKAKLIEIINRPLDPNDKATAQSENFLQTVAAELLGELHAADAFKPLFKTLIVANKQATQIPGTALVAIVKMGKDAVQPAVDVLTGKDTEIVDLAKKEAGNDATQAMAYINQAASVLGGIGRTEAMQPIIDMIGKKEVSDNNRVVLAAALPNLPAKAEAVQAIEKAFEAVDAKFVIPANQVPGRRYIADAATKMMDNSLVPWGLKQALAAKGEDQELTQQKLLELVLKVMKKEQIEEAKKVFETKDVADPVSAKNFKDTVDLLNACDAKVECYLQKIEDKETNEAKPFIGIKSAYMVAIIGGAAKKPDLLKALPKIKNPGVRGATLLAIAYLSPVGDPKVADELQKIMDDNTAKLDAEQAGKANSGLRDIVLILRARAS